MSVYKTEYNCCTLHNAAQNSSDTLTSYPPISIGRILVYWRGREGLGTMEMESQGGNRLTRVHQESGCHTSVCACVGVRAENHCLRPRTEGGIRKWAAVSVCLSVPCLKITRERKGLERSEGQRSRSPGRLMHTQ